MHVISKRRLREFWEAGYADAREALESWFRAASRAEWRSIAEVRQTYSYADAVGLCTVFNIRGNSYRLIVKIEYARQLVFVKKVLTHAEYSKDKWKDACNC